MAEASRHLHEAYAEEHAAGAEEQAAERRAIERFGSARDVAESFRATLPVRHVTTRRVAALVAAGLVAALIATVVQETSSPESPHAPQASAAPSRMSAAGASRGSSSLGGDAGGLRRGDPAPTSPSRPIPATGTRGGGKGQGGPTWVDRFPEGDTVRWLRDREPRGRPLPEARIRDAGFGRLLAPRPHSRLRVALWLSERTATDAPTPFTVPAYENRDICVALLDVRERAVVNRACGNEASTPFIGLRETPTADGRITVIGAVTDQVARLDLYADGEATPVPIADGAFLALAAPSATGVPLAKLVAYDAVGQVIGIFPDQPNFGTSPERPDESQRRTLIDLTPSVGATARVDAAPSNLGGTCWWISLGKRARTGCLPDTREAEEIGPIGLFAVDRVGKNGPLVLMATTREDVASLRFEYPDGRSSPIPLVERFVLVAMPVDLVREGDAAVVAADADGTEVARLDATTTQPIYHAPDRPPSQQATARGVSVRIDPPPTTGAVDALVTIDLTNVPDDVARALTPRRDPADRRASVDCVRLDGEPEHPVPVTYGFYVEVGSQTTVPLHLEPPLDGCRLPGSRSRRWNDRWGGRPVIELPLTERGRRYYAERDAIDDLALFIRTPAIRAIRRSGGTVPTSEEIVARFPGAAVVSLADRAGSPPIGTVGLWSSGTRLVAVEITPAGERLYVELDRGVIARTNIRRRTHLGTGALS